MRLGRAVTTLVLSSLRNNAQSLSHHRPANMSRQTAAKTMLSSVPHGSTLSALDRARSIPPPSREDTLNRSPIVYNYWSRFDDTFQKAWPVWEEEMKAQKRLPLVGPDIFHPKLRAAVEAAWKDPSKEAAVRELWKEVSPGVYQCQFFDPEKVEELRKFYAEASASGIPLRQPYGITLNRNGFMVHPRSNGHLGAPTWQAFYQELTDRYMRPIGRMLFPEDYGTSNDDYDSQAFGFTIQYRPTTDTKIRDHTDASTITLNINLDSPPTDGENTKKVKGSALYFYDPATHERNYVSFSSGVAMLHRGSTMHAALPITAGERNNLVLWLNGPDGSTPPPTGRGYNGVCSTPEERWSLPINTSQDSWAPF